MYVYKLCRSLLCGDVPDRDFMKLIVLHQYYCDVTAQDGWYVSIGSKYRRDSVRVFSCYFIINLRDPSEEHNGS